MKRGELHAKLTKIVALAQSPKIVKKRTLAEALEDLQRIEKAARDIMKDLTHAIPITGLWVRTSGDKEATKIEVLVEREGEWRLMQVHPMYMSLDQEISYITEPAGLERGLPDPLDAKKEGA